MTLVIMAAGMGSRFGGLKQIEPVGPNGEFIIDYSIYDAIKAGFNKVIFIIKEENYEIFKDTIGKRIENKIEVEYVFQDMKNIPDGINIPKERVKPFGTGHAILSLKGHIDTPFTVINADDFYGADAYKKASQFLSEETSDYAMIGYKIGNTLTENGKVKRGYCEEEEGYLTNLVEASVYSIDGKVKIEPLDGSESFFAKPDTLVSMNMFCLRPDMIDYLDSNFKKFFMDNKDNLLNCEYLMPSLIFERIKKKEVKVRVIDTDSVWMGITYKDDKQLLVDNINKLIEKGIYPKKI